MQDRRLFRMVVLIGVFLNLIAVLVSPFSAQHIYSQEPSQTIRIWHAYTGPVETTLAALADTYNTQNPQHIPVEVISMGSRGQLYDQMILYLPDDQGDNILPHAIITRPDDVALFALSGRIVDLDTLHASETSDVFMEAVPRIGQVANGQRFGWPLHLHTEVMIVNDDALAELGVGLPTTLDDWLAVTCQFRAAGGWSRGDLGVVWGASIPLRSTFFFGLLAANRSDFTTNEPAFMIHLEQPETANLMAKLQQARQDNCINHSNDRNDALERFVDGQALFYFANTSELASIQSAINSAYIDPFDWNVYPLPGMAAEPIAYVHGTVGAVVDQDLDSNQAAWEFLQWLSETEQQVEWVRATQGFPTTQQAAARVSDDLTSFEQWEQALRVVTDSARTSLPMLAGGDVIGLEIEFALERIMAGSTIETEIPQLEGRIAAIIQHFEY